jgi:5,10-methylenetetrahydromethanopterin reductase
MPRRAATEARRAEDEGWDGLGFNDNQCLTGDPLIEMALAAAATERLKVTTAVTNPVTRHPAVMASALGTIQVESNGRAEVGIARGDSALAYLGLAPVPPTLLERYVTRLQGYLRGDEVPFDVEGDGRGQVLSAEVLGYVDRPRASTLRWLARFESAKVPVEVAASGPRVLAIAGRTADRVLLAVGTDPKRVAWAKDVVRNARGAGGLDPAGIAFGANIPIVVHPDRETARRAVAPTVTGTARFAAMQRSYVGSLRLEQLDAVRKAYDMNQHGRSGSPQAGILEADVIDAFSIAGPVSYCVERLVELRELGITKFHLRGAPSGDDIAEPSRALLVKEVLPAVR